MLDARWHYDDCVPKVRRVAIHKTRFLPSTLNGHQYRVPQIGLRLGVGFGCNLVRGGRCLRLICVGAISAELNLISPGGTCDDMAAQTTLDCRKTNVLQPLGRPKTRSPIILC
jgi:hypothetical protein